jgi:hypothetical protein
MSIAHTLRLAAMLACAAVFGAVADEANAQQRGDCGYYTNSNGHEVPRPCGNWRADTGVVPQGATALCRDGTYSYSEHPYAKGTCSYHGGVVKHLRQSGWKTDRLDHGSLAGVVCYSNAPAR